MFSHKHRLAHNSVNNSAYNSKVIAIIIAFGSPPIKLEGREYNLWFLNLNNHTTCSGNERTGFSKRAQIGAHFSQNYGCFHIYGFWSLLV